MKFLTEIKAALKKAGLSESLADQINVETVGEVEGAVGKLKSDSDKITNLNAEDFIAAIEKAGLSPALKRYMVAEVDRRVKDVVDTHDQNLKLKAEEAKKAEATKKAEADQAEKLRKGEMTPEEKRFAGIEESIGKLADMVAGVTTTIATKDISGEIDKALKGAGIPGEFAGYIRVTEATEIPDAVKGLKSLLNTSTQAEIDQKLEKGDLSPVKKGEAGQTLQEDQIAEYAANRTSGGPEKNADFPGRLTAEASK